MSIACACPTVSIMIHPTIIHGRALCMPRHLAVHHTLPTHVRVGKETWQARTKAAPRRTAPQPQGRTRAARNNLTWGTFTFTFVALGGGGGAKGKGAYNMAIQHGDE